MKYLHVFLFVLISVFLTTTCFDKQKPKNIILFIGDGYGFNHMLAADYYQYGKTGQQSYQKFPICCAMSTYPAGGYGYDPVKAWSSFTYVKKKYTDSAAAGTALACGVKTRNGILGMDSSYTRVTNATEKMREFGKATGVVTSVQFYHATPACFVAHDSSRSNYLHIINQMIYQSELAVIMGCGHPLYDDHGKAKNTSYNDSVWQEIVAQKAGNDIDGDGLKDVWTFIEKREDFQRLISGETPQRVLGVAHNNSTLQSSRPDSPNALPYELPFIESVPTLKEMTQAAINVLDNNPEGFFLMVEGGAIDWAAHGNNSTRVIEESIAFNEAIEAAVSWIEANSNWNETLVIITADHETGYLTGPGSGQWDSTAADSMHLWQPLTNNGKNNLPGMEWHSGSHTNSLVPFFAKGAGSKVFKHFADETDPVRGKYLDNTEVAQALFRFYGKDKQLATAE
jgi:alkaline phosphatase